MSKKNKTTMFIGSGLVTITIPEACSLKDKRSVVKSLVERLGRELRMSAAEVGSLDTWDQAEIGFACVSNSAAHADEMIAKAVNWIEKNLVDGYLAGYQTEIIQAF